MLVRSSCSCVRSLLALLLDEEWSRQAFSSTERLLDPFSRRTYESCLFSVSLPGQNFHATADGRAVLGRHCRLMCKPPFYVDVAAP